MHLSRLQLTQPVLWVWRIQSAVFPEGKVASIILLDRNPLEDVRNTRSIHRVMIEGNWI